MRSNNLAISETLRKTAASTVSRSMTIRELLETLGDRGLLLLTMILTAPFLLPISIPGSSTPFGLLIAFFGTSLLSKRGLRLPKRLENYRLSDKVLKAILNGGTRIFSRIERLSKPRLFFMTTGSTMRMTNGVLLIVCGLLLTAPLPLPLSNTIPAYGVLFLSAGTLMRDGLLLIAGYVMLLLTIAYFTAVALFGVAGVKLIFAGI
jgi:hypothetical protein